MSFCLLPETWDEWALLRKKTVCLTNVLQFFNLTTMPFCPACIFTSGKGLFKMK